MANDIQREVIEELRDRIAQLEHELESVRLERDQARRESRAAAGQAAAVVREVGPRAPINPAGHGLCSFCDGEGTYWVHDFEMKCRRCDGTGYAKQDTSELPLSER